MGLFLLSLLVLTGLVTPAAAGNAAEGLGCLAVYDLECARAASEGSGDAAALLRAKIKFHDGDFVAAEREMSALAPSHEGDERFEHELAHYRATAAATEGFDTATRGDIQLRYQPGTDQILIEEALSTLDAARSRIGTMLGGAPPGGVRMEIYPTADRFTLASGLPRSAVMTTGVVALSKWTRLLVTSPKALGRGYAWKDTVAHEYIHYVVAWRTRDQAPVWLQEGIARSYESLWRDTEFAPLAPNQQALLARALASDSLVPLERMHPSMAFLDSADEAALAFAQVSTMMQHLHRTAGPDAVSRVLDRVRDGKDALEAVSEVAGMSPDQFMASWRAGLAAMDLVARKLGALPTVLDPTDDYGLDPLLAARADLAGFARLGDLLLEKNRPQAALIEYRKAVPADEPPSPVLSAHMAQAWIATGGHAEARQVLEASVLDYPEFALTRKTLGALLQAVGQLDAALLQYRASADINPFDPEVQAALADLYSVRGEKQLAELHQRNRRILMSGGFDRGAEAEHVR